MKIIITLFLLILSTLIFIGCDPNMDDQPDPPVDPVIKQTQTLLMAHTWVQDSIGYKSAGNEAIVFTEPKNRVKYGSSQSYGSVGTGPVTDSLFYEVGDSNKLYFWRRDTQKDTSQYNLIDEITDHSLVVSLPSYNPYAFYYYHAE